MQKNVASQSVTLYAVDASTGLPKSGDSANMLYYVSKDDGTVTLITAASGVPTEVDSTNAKGSYKIALAQAETNATKLLFTGKSSTSNVVVVPQTIYTTPANFALAVIDSSGLSDANAVKVGPTGAGTAQTARDLGASVLLAASQHVIVDSGTVTTVTNQLTAAAIATGVWTDTTAGDFTTALSVGKSVMNGVTLGTGLTVAAVSGAVGSVTAGVTVTTNNDKTGYALTQTFPTNFSALGISAGGHITTVDTLTTYTGNTPQTGDAYARLGLAGAGLTALGDTRIAHLDADVSSRSTYAGGDTSGTTTLLSRVTAAVALASQIPANFTTACFASAGVFSVGALANAPSGTGASAASIATYLFQDLTSSSDFSTAGSFGALVKANLNAPVGSIPTNPYTGTPPSVVQIRQEIDANSTQLATIAAKTGNLPASPAAVSDIPTAVQVADTAIRRTHAHIEASATGDPLDLHSWYGMMRMIQSATVAGTTMTVKKSDGSTLGTLTLTATPGADPITGVQ